MLRQAEILTASRAWYLAPLCTNQRSGRTILDSRNTYQGVSRKKAYGLPKSVTKTMYTVVQSNAEVIVSIILSQTGVSRMAKDRK